MSLSYKLNKDLLHRNAAQLVFSFNELPYSVFLYKQDIGRRINGKSLIGVLSGRFLKGEIIDIIINGAEDWSRVKEILNNFGTEV